MKREDTKVGMLVLFGRGRGEKTRGKVVKLNPTKAKVETLEDRGRRSPKGTVWSVPYSMMTPLDEYANVEGVETNTYSTTEKDTAYHISVAIASCYADKLDASSSQLKEIDRTLRYLFLALGEELTAVEAREYLEAV